MNNNALALANVGCFVDISWVIIEVLSYSIIITHNLIQSPVLWAYHCSNYLSTSD